MIYFVNISISKINAIWRFFIIYIYFNILLSLIIFYIYFIMQQINREYNKCVGVKLCLLATINCFLCGYNIGVLNSSILNLAHTLGWSESNLASVCNALLAFGAIIGSAIAGKVANKYGRIKGMMLVDIISILSCCFVIII